MNKGGLYFHIPFCLRKCAYCDFCSFTDVSSACMEAYVDAQVREMQAMASIAQDTVFDTVFFGGGTPTLLSIPCVNKLLNYAKSMFNIEQNAEITMEANPATADEEKLSRLREMGINRLSVGVQSFVDSELRALGRLHSAKDACAFLQKVRRAGFQNVNVDLMYGIPTQTEQSAAYTLAVLLDFSPEHVSAYSLMLEEGTPLYRQKDTLVFPGEEEEDAIDLIVRDTLRKHGYCHYEISNYAQKGYESKHNLHYWHSDPYLGFGVAAYSFFSGTRYGNHEDLSAYIADPAHAMIPGDVLTEEDLAYEWIMLRLRLAEGLSLSEYKARFGVDLEEKYADTIASYRNLGLCTVADGRLALSERGFRVSNTILTSLMSDEKNS